MNEKKSLCQDTTEKKYTLHEKLLLKQTNMDSWKAITAQLGQPDQRWPKHRGHLKQSDRFRLVAFLFLNDVPQPIIRKLSSTKQIYLRDAKAKTHWMSCVDVMNTPAKLHKYRTATYHKISTGGRVHLDNTPVATPAPRTTSPKTIVTLVNLL